MLKSRFAKHSEKDWNNIVKKIGETPLLLGKLLNNEMPTELEEATGFSFIPSSFTSECSCPDYANPCKHIAAVFYTLADEIDHDPMHLFLIQGMGRDELFSRLEMGDTMQVESTTKATKLKKQKKRKSTKSASRKKGKIGKVKKHG